MNSAQYWIDQLRLEPHPEGGFYREIYRSDEHIPAEGLPQRYHNSRAFATSIYFLLTSGQPSLFHALLSDELWFFHTGSAVTLHSLTDEAGYKTILLGPEPQEHHHFSALMRAGTWFGATVEHPDSYALLSCVVTPGFDFNDFTLASRSHLLKEFPVHAAIIEALTKG